MNKEYKITVKHVLNTILKGVSNGNKTFYPLYVQVNCRRQFTKFPSKWNFDFAVEDFDLEKNKISNILNKEIEVSITMLSLKNKTITFGEYNPTGNIITIKVTDGANQFTLIGSYKASTQSFESGSWLTSGNSGSWSAKKEY